MADPEKLSEWTVKLGGIETIALGHGRCYVVGGEEIAVFRQRDGRLFATQNRCPHRQGPLSEGVSGGGHVICPLHSHRFNLKNGAGSEPNECIQVHRVKDLDGEILLRLSRPLSTSAHPEREGVQCEIRSGEEQMA
jgi:nitrite reductase [NAD(P)H] small subunit